MGVLRGAALLAATLTTGLMAGVFGLYSHSIMPGLRRTDDRTFVGAFQSIDRAIINPWFMASFLGALACTTLAAVVHLGPAQRQVLPWILAALVGYLAAFVVTFAVNVPLNNTLQAAGDPDRIGDLAAARQRFDEVRWTVWNLVRTLTSTAAFVCLAWSLIKYGQRH